MSFDPSSILQPPAAAAMPPPSTSVADVNRLESPAGAVTPITDINQLTGQGPTPPPTFHQNVQRAELGDESIKTGDYDVYKARAKHVDRIGLINPRDIVWGRIHYVEAGQTKGYFVCNTVFDKQNGVEVPQRMAVCCEKFGLPSKRFAALIIHYGTDASGRLLTPFSYSLKVWRFGEKVFDQLRTQNREMPLEQHDLLVSCQDEQFQKISFSACKESLVHNQTFRETPSPTPNGVKYGMLIDAYVASMMPRLDRTVGTNASSQEWAVLVGAAGGPSAGFGAVGQTVADAPIPDIRTLLQTTK